MQDTQADASESLRAEFQERQAQLEQRHLQEVERLRSYYQQQAKETQERYATEVILLQNRLQELTGTDPQFRYLSLSIGLIVQKHFKLIRWLFRLL